MINLIPNLLIITLMLIGTLFTALLAYDLIILQPRREDERRKEFERYNK